MDHRAVARILAAARIAVGAGLLLAPRRLGGRVGGPGSTWALRALGARDAALGIGALRAMDRGQPVGPWVAAGAVADGADAVAALLAARSLGTGRAMAVAAVAGAAAALGAQGATRVD